MTNKRPLPLTITGVLVILSALLYLTLGALLFVSGDINLHLNVNDIVTPEGSAESVFTEEASLALIGLTYIVYGGIQLVIGIGFWLVRRWAWIALMTILLFELLIELGSFFADTIAPWTLAFAIPLVFMLNQADVRRAFGILRREHESPSIQKVRPGDVN